MTTMPTEGRAGGPEVEERLRAMRVRGLPARPPVLPEGDVSYAEHEGPVGRLLVATTGRGVVACSYAEPDAVLDRVASAVSPRVLRGGPRVDAVRRELDEYFAGRRTTFDLGVDWALAGDFQRQVLRALAAMPFGSRTTYGDLARRIGAPTASRAVGGALGANPVCVVVPCHRVVRSDGSLSGYAGGLDAKRWLLDHESGATAEAPRP